MPLIFILIVLLASNWLFLSTFVFIPLNLLFRLQSLGYWGLALLILVFLAWCIGDD
jgi:hypothetical protein